MVPKGRNQKQAKQSEKQSQRSKLKTLVDIAFTDVAVCGAI